MSRAPRVAIACQGGGSHAAFIAGVLCKLLGPDFRNHFELTAISGTSGGDICASLAWAGLIAEGPDNALQRLQGFWNDLAGPGAGSPPRRVAGRTAERGMA